MVWRIFTYFCFNLFKYRYSGSSYHVGENTMINMFRKNKREFAVSFSSWIISPISLSLKSFRKGRGAEDLCHHPQIILRKKWRGITHLDEWSQSWAWVVVGLGRALSAVFLDVPGLRNMVSGQVLRSQLFLSEAFGTYIHVRNLVFCMRQLSSATVSHGGQYFIYIGSREDYQSKEDNLGRTVVVKKATDSGTYLWFLMGLHDTFSEIGAGKLSPKICSAAVLSLACVDDDCSLRPQQYSMYCQLQNSLKIRSIFEQKLSKSF